ncbi:hypothetical protein BDV93DRAFT_497429 [Ceratobasidium sp. AG-I]|nr:hypothetical protein BDV93DRAFT_497429 [Ceratobasidium sp. AG-I]
MKFKEISLNFTNPRRGFGTKSSESVHDASVPHVPAQTASKPPDTETKDPVSVDPPGEELNPDASVWRLYMLEAKDCDQELAKCRNANLDTMLIFAALFSAILTAFLIESTGLLQEDHAATSAALLLLIAQSQQRTEVGLLHGSSIPVTARPFVVAASARWVNGLWFVALALSLSAALLAITAKEWINEFIGSYAKAPHDFALERQARWDALESWRALHILDFLPTLLHVSLVCFALGLVIYLWLLDQVIAVVLALIIGVTAVLYLGTIFCGAVFELCPFVTRISVYLRIAIRAYTGANGKSHKLRIPAGEVTTARDLRALWWLMDNARDQTHRDCASRALVGLRSRRLDDISHPLEGLESAQDIAVNQSILSSIFIRLCGLVEQQLPTCPHTLDGPSTADDGSHAAALSELVAGTSSHSLGEFQVALESIEPRCNVLRHVPQPVGTYD